MAYDPERGGRLQPGVHTELRVGYILKKNGGDGRKWEPSASDEDMILLRGVREFDLYSPGNELLGVVKGRDPLR